MVNISGSPMNRLRGKFTSCKITRREDLTDDLFKIWLKPLEPFSFKPGQYCTIGVDGLERPYSIVSSPDEEEIELFIEVVPPPEGNLTPILHELDIGTELSLRPRAKGRASSIVKPFSKLTIVLEERQSKKTSKGTK